MKDLAGGRYRLEEVIGQGGFATVWRGYDTALGVHRAIKLLHSNLSGRDSFRDRLRAEARAMARLAHPNVLTVHDIGVQDDQDFFVMDLVEGGSLADWQQRCGPMPPDLAVQCAIQVLSALSAAHVAGIVHRDVKPQNVLLDADGRCRLADFGIALLESEEMLRSTKTGATMGSLSYMAPEQRLSAKDVGPEADIYAVGSTLYALLTDSNAIDLFTALPSSPRWAKVPEPLLPILQHATQLDPGHRYCRAADMAAALAKAQPELPEESWDEWLARSPTSISAGPTLALPTMDVLQRSTRQALTILEELPEAPVRPTAVPMDVGSSATVPAQDVGRAEETMFPDSVGDPSEAGAHEAPADTPPPKRAPTMRLAVAAAAILLGGGLWLWAPWEAPEPSLAPPTDPVTEIAPDPPVDAVADEPSPEGAAPEPLPEESEADAVADAEPEQPSGEAPTPAPAPVETEAQEAPPAPDHEPIPTTASTAAGRWTGSYGAMDAVLELDGSDDALTGTLSTEFFGNVQASTVRGSLVDGRLVLEDVERTERYNGSHVGSLVGTNRIEGQTTTYKEGRVTSFSFTR